MGGQQSGTETTLANPYSAQLQLAEAKWEAYKQDHNWPIQITPGTGFIVGAKVTGGLTAAAGLGLTGEVVDVPGPTVGNGKGMKVTATGGGSLGADIKGEISAGGYIGAPIANIALQGFIQLKGKLETSFNVGGGFTVDPAGNATGIITFDATASAKVEGIGGAKITYTAVIVDGEFGRWEMASVTIAEASIKAKVSIDLATGEAIDETTTKLDFLPDLPKPTQVEKRPLTKEEREKYQKDEKREKDQRDGGSGSGPGGGRDPHEGEEDGDE
jgi:hypothetical protein